MPRSLWCECVFPLRLHALDGAGSVAVPLASCTLPQVTTYRVSRISAPRQTKSAASASLLATTFRWLHWRSVSMRMPK